ncbi:MAG: hypothetical protein AAF517_15985 [Planctomycetota bacterium]
MAKASKDVFGVTEEGVGGEADGVLRFWGKVGDPKALTGQGRGRIVEAKLGPVPLFHRVAELLELPREGAVFSELTIPYNISRGRFWSESIDMRSKLLALKGRGSLDFRGGLDIVLQPVFFDVPIPIFDQILGLVKKVISEVEVKGTLSEPKVNFKAVGVDIPIGDSNDKPKPKPKAKKPAGSTNKK